MRTTRNAELVVVLGEDLAAIFGLVLAFVFIALATVTGNPRFDAAGSVCIGIVLIVVSVFVASRIKSLIVGRSAEPEVRERIAAVLAADAHVTHVYNTLDVAVRPKVMLAARSRSARPHDREAIDGINALERRLRSEVPELGWCFVEPDNED